MCSSTADNGDDIADVPLASRVWLIINHDEHGDAVVSWGQFEEAGNEPETMEALAEMRLGEHITLGQCDHVRRIA